MNTRLKLLQPYPFERLARLLEGVTPPTEKTAIRWSIGEPAHDPPEFALDTLRNSLRELGSYPTTKGLHELRSTIADWLVRRYGLNGFVEPDSNVLPVSGTREALFSISQAVLDCSSNSEPLAVLPNPFYQIYEGASLLAGARPYFLNLLPENGFRPDFSTVAEAVWQECQLAFVCSPSNPTGACLSMDDWRQLLDLSEKHGFVIASDECYSEIYRSEPPVGLLQAAIDNGNEKLERCLVFHSLSKRSNLPGMRSGFVAGDAEILAQYLLYRTYHGCTMSVPVQRASIAAWSQEDHVEENRKQYREKFSTVLKILGSRANGLEQPDGSFYLWFPTPYDDELFAKHLFAEENLLVLPGSYLSRDSGGINPGARRVRMALVAPLESCAEGAERLRSFLDRKEAS